MCDSDVDFDSDQLVSCDACGLTVHQSCYGVPDLPGEDDMWLCRPCELKVHAVPCSCRLSAVTFRPVQPGGRAPLSRTSTWTAGILSGNLGSRIRY